MRTKLILYIIFFVSGLSGIIYQILWIRLLALAFGGVTLVTTFVTSAFLAGLAFGGLFGGKLIDRFSEKNLRYLFLIYAGIEFIIATFGIVNWLVFSSFSNVSGEWRWIISAVLIIVQTMAMGATWPAMFKILLGLGNEWHIAGIVSFINTVGAACGALLSSFLLIGNLGITGTLTFAIVGNFVAAAVVWLVSNRFSLGKTHKPIQTLNPIQQKTSLKFSFKSLFYVGGILFVTGFVGMALEIIWMRVFALIFGSSVYAFSIVLTVILLGLAIGGLLVHHLQFRRPLTTLMWVVWLNSLAILLGMVLIPQITTTMAHYATQIELNFLSVQSQRLYLASLVVLMPSVFSGMALPLGILALKTQFSAGGRESGAAYGFNTLGAVIGGVSGGLLIIPRLGLEKGIVLLTVVLGIIPAVTLVRQRAYGKAVVTVSLLILLAFLGSNRWNQHDLAMGVFLYGKQVLGEVSGIKLLSYHDGREATVATTLTQGVTTLRINGKADASDSDDIGTEAVLGHVPILLHQNPKNVLIIGLGSGITSGAIAQHRKVEHLTTVEIEPEVAKAAQSYFAKENYDVLTNPKHELVIADGRNYLLKTNQQFDVITAEPSNPWIAGEGNLFTKEFFELGKKRLAPGGLFFQWLHLYNLKHSEVKTIVKTFTSVFPYTQVWVSPDPVDIFLAGKTEPFVLYWDRFQEALANEDVQDSLKRRDFADEIRLFSLLWSGNRKTQEMGEGAEINTDRRPILEYRAPLGLLENTLPENLGILASAFQDDSELFRIEGMPPAAQEIFIKGREARRLKVEAKRVFYGGDLTQAIRLAEQSYSVDHEVSAGNRFLAELYTKLGNSLKTIGAGEQMKQEELEYFRKAIELRPNYYPAYESLIPAYVAAGEATSAANLVDEAKLLFPWSGTLLMYEGILAGMNGDNNKAEELLLQAKELEPGNVLIYNNLAHLYYIQYKRKKSIELWRESLRLNPNQPEIQDSLSKVENMKGL